MMNKKMLGLTLAAAFAAVPVVSMATPPEGGAFVSAQAGQSHLQGMTATNNTDTGYGFDLGYRWAVSPFTAVGVELGYVDQGTFKDYYAGTRTKARIDGAKLGVNAKFDFTPQWFLMMQAGLFNAHTRLDVTSATAGLSDSRNRSSWYSGIGVGYNLTDSVSLSLDFNHFDNTFNLNQTHFDLSSDQTALRLEARF